MASTSLGHRQATVFPAWPTLLHMPMNRSVNSFIPKKNMVEYLNDSPGFLPRPKNHASHGTIVVQLGIPLASHWSDTGLEVSGVPDATTRSTLSLLIRSRATLAARTGSDWVSLTMISTLRVLPPDLIPLAKRLPGLGDDEVVGQREAGEWSGLRADIADLDGVRPAAGCRGRALVPLEVGGASAQDAAATEQHGAGAGATQQRASGEFRRERCLIRGHAIS